MYKRSVYGCAATCSFRLLLLSPYKVFALIGLIVLTFAILSTFAVQSNCLIIFFSCCHLTKLLSSPHHFDTYSLVILFFICAPYACTCSAHQITQHAPVLSWARTHMTMHTFLTQKAPLVISLGVAGGFLLEQPDTVHMAVVRAAFKLGQRVNFALWRKMLYADCSPSIDFTGLYKSPKWRIVLYFFEANVKWNSTQPYLTSVHVNSKQQWKKWLLKLISAFFNVSFCLGNWQIRVNESLTCLLKKNRCDQRALLLLPNWVWAAKQAKYAISAGLAPRC